MKLGETTLGATAACIALIPSLFLLFSDRRKSFIPDKILQFSNNVFILPYEQTIVMGGLDIFAINVVFIASVVALMTIILIGLQNVVFYEQSKKFVGPSLLAYLKRVAFVVLVAAAMRYFAIYAMRHPAFLLDTADRKAAGVGALLYVLAPAIVILGTFVISSTIPMVFYAIDLWRKKLLVCK